jgi:F0F1-type ATP synthase beta subunit
MIEGGVIKVDKDGKPIDGSKAALVYGQMNEPPGNTTFAIVFAN